MEEKISNEAQPTHYEEIISFISIIVPLIELIVIAAIFRAIRI